MTTKVLINVPRLDMRGGVANYYAVLRRYLDSEKHYFEIGQKIGESGILTSFARALVDYWRFHRKLSTGGYSVVHLNPSVSSKSIWRDGLFLLIARAHSVPVVAFFHGWDSTLITRIRFMYRAIVKNIFGRATSIIVLADEFRRQLKSIGIKVPVFRMTTLVDDSIFSKAIAERSARSPRNILILSRLDPGKGLVEAVHTFALLKRTVPDSRLIVAGDGPERAVAEEVIARQNIEDITFVGYVTGDAKRQVFEDADIYFLPTLLPEGMPTTVLEAMAYGLPVVTRAVGGLNDFFENQKMGFITISTNPEKFAEYLQRILQEPGTHQRMGEYNRRFARENFAASKIASSLNDIYGQAIDN